MFAPESFRVVGVRADGTQRRIAGSLRSRTQAERVRITLAAGGTYPEFPMMLIEVEKPPSAVKPPE